MFSKIYDLSFIICQKDKLTYTHIYTYFAYILNSLLLRLREEGCFMLNARQIFIQDYGNIDYVFILCAV